MKNIDITSDSWIEDIQSHIQNGIELRSVCAGWKYKKFPVFVDQYGIEPILIDLTDITFPLQNAQRITSIDVLGDFLLSEINKTPLIKCGEFPVVSLKTNLEIIINIGFLNFMYTDDCERFSEIRIDFEFQPVNP